MNVSDYESKYKILKNRFNIISFKAIVYGMACIWLLYYLSHLNSFSKELHLPIIVSLIYTAIIFPWRSSMMNKINKDFSIIKKLLLEKEENELLLKRNMQPLKFDEYSIKLIEMSCIKEFISKYKNDDPQELINWLEEYELSEFWIGK